MERNTVVKVFQCDFYWPTLFCDAFKYCKSFSRCQQLDSIGRRNMIPLNPIIVVDILEVWDIDFIRPFSSFFENDYILLITDYV